MMKRDSCGEPLMIRWFADNKYQVAVELGTIPVTTGYSWIFLWDNTFHQWGYKYLQLVKGQCGFDRMNGDIVGM